MTEKMTIKQAIETILEHVDCLQDGMFPVEIKQAAEILRNGTEPVEVVEKEHMFVCTKCGDYSDSVRPYDGGFLCYHCGCRVKKNQVWCNKIYYTRHVLKIKNKNSVPVYEEVPQ